MTKRQLRHSLRSSLT